MQEVQLGRSRQIHQGCCGRNARLSADSVEKIGHGLRIRKACIRDRNFYFWQRFPYSASTSPRAKKKLSPVNDQAVWVDRLFQQNWSPTFLEGSACIEICGITITSYCSR